MIEDDANKKIVNLGQFKDFQKDVNNNFKGVRKEINGIKNIVNQHSTTFKEIKKILNQHTDALLSIESTMKFYGDMYKINKENIDKLDYRLETLEKA